MSAKELRIETTPIPGLLVIHLPVHGDARGWFKENWQREKMVGLGLPDFQPVQNNISFNQAEGVTRGIHAEPWDKFISVATGKVFGAWVDLREGESFGTVFTHEIDPETAIFVPSGVGNSFQTLEAPTAYTYLVNDHWSEAAQSKYTFLNLADDTVNIDWPIPLEQAELSEKDKNHPFLKDVTPMQGKRTLVIGAGGQLGRALADLWANRNDVDFVDRDQLNIGDAESINAFDFSPYDTIVNAAAYTAVDKAETAEGRVDAWAVNAAGPAALARVAREISAILVHVSSDYVFDGTEKLHTETESFAPLGIYGQSKAAGDIAVATLPQHYLVRTSWVVGDGNNFVRTMASLAERGIDPKVVSDQHGRLTFTQDLAAGIDHLLQTRPEFGTYNLSCDGEVSSWADIAAEVYRLTGHDGARVTPVTTAEYFAGASSDNPISPRPTHSALDLAKIKATGFTPRDAGAALQAYLEE